MPGDLRQGVSPTAHGLLDIADGYHRFCAVIGAPVGTSPDEISAIAAGIVAHPGDETAVRRAVGYLIAVLEAKAGDGLEARS